MRRITVVLRVLWLILHLTHANSGRDTSRGSVYYLHHGPATYLRDSRGLIPFPRIGRSHGTWQLGEEEKSPTAGESHSLQPTVGIARNSRSATTVFSRRLLRSDPRQLIYSPRQLLSDPKDQSSQGDSKPSKDEGRIHDPSGAESGEWSGPRGIHPKRLLRAEPNTIDLGRLQRSTVFLDSFKRRLMKKSAEETSAPMVKRRLIPFPRTGKRSASQAPIFQSMEYLDALEPLESFDVDVEERESENRNQDKEYEPDRNHPLLMIGSADTGQL